VDVDAVDLLDRRDADTPGRAFGQLGVDRFPFGEGQILRIVDAARKAVAIEDARASNHRACERSAASLIDSGKRLREFELELEGTAPRHRHKPMETLSESPVGAHVFCGLVCHPPRREASGLARLVEEDNVPVRIAEPRFAPHPWLVARAMLERQAT